MPFTTARCVLPGNPQLRLSNKNPIVEVFVFFGFALLLLTTMPLMANGFWTSYNKAFSSFLHLEREYSKSNDLIYLQTKEGRNGEVVSASAEGAIIFTGNRFIALSEKQYNILSFQHTKRKKKIQHLEFVEVSADSMRKILQQPIIKIKANASNPIRYRVAGQQFEQASLALDYPSGFDFVEVKTDNSAVENRINNLLQTIKSEQQTAAIYRKEQAVKAATLGKLNAGFGAMSEYEKGKAIEEIAKLKAVIQAATPPVVSVEAQAAPAEIERLKKSVANQKHTFTGVAEIWNR